MKRTARQMGIKIGDIVEVLEGKYEGQVRRIIDIGVTTTVKIDVPISINGNPTSTAWIPAKSVKIIPDGSYNERSVQTSGAVQ